MILAIAGPTAAGKSALGLSLAERLNGEIVSVDSAQVYRGLDIGSAKPSPEERSRVRHWLIDIREPTQPYSAADFATNARSAIADIQARGKIPILVGGTMLYLRALRDGLSTLPGADAQVRAALQIQLQDAGLAALHAELASVDPVSAARIHPNDKQRTLRALEVFRSTGRPLSAQLGSADAGLSLRIIAVAPADRGLLHQRIETRLRTMFASGFVDEVRVLMQQPGMHADLPSMRSVGYRQVWLHLEGEFDADQCFQRALYATRQLAKRQLTWLRGDTTVTWLDPTHGDPATAAADLGKQFQATETTPVRAARRVPDQSP